MKTLVLLFAALAVANAARTPNTPPPPQPLRVLLQSRDGVTPLTAGETVFYPYALDKGCTINALDMVIAPLGATASVDVWVAPDGSTVPSAANSITGTNAPAINSGQHIHLIDFSAWTNKLISPHAVLGFYVKYATGATQIAVGIQCQQ